MRNGVSTRGEDKEQKKRISDLCNQVVTGSIYWQPGLREKVTAFEC